MLSELLPQQKFPHKINYFMKIKLYSKDKFISNGRIESGKCSHFLFEFFFLILKILDLDEKFYYINDRTIEYFKYYYRFIFVNMILERLDKKIQSDNRVLEVPGSNPASGFGWELLLRQELRQSFLDSP